MDLINPDSSLLWIDSCCKEKNKRRKKLFLKERRRNKKISTWILNFNFWKLKLVNWFQSQEKNSSQIFLAFCLNLSNTFYIQLKSLRFYLMSRKKFMRSKARWNGDLMIYLVDFISQIVWINRRRFV